MAYRFSRQSEMSPAFGSAPKTLGHIGRLVAAWLEATGIPQALRARQSHCKFSRTRIAARTIGGGDMAIEDDDRPRKKVSHEIGQDLSLLSVEELTERIALLTAEIERLQTASAKKRASKDAANSIFKS
jgi:uncharacterized small protein (DUF1192 family)